MTTYIIGAGHTDYDYVKKVLAADEEERFIIAADRGVETCMKIGITPDYIIGDFDSAAEGTYEMAKGFNVPLTKLNPIKDDSDSEAALNVAFLHSTGDIYFLCGTGSRLDHVLGNISILGQGFSHGRKVYLMDENNKIEMLNGESTLEISRDKQHGRYISVFAYMGEVKGLSMTGFKYPLCDFTLGGFTTLTVSNEIVEPKAVISIKEGTLIVLQTRD